MKKFSRRALGGILAGAAVRAPVRGQEAAREAPVDEMARAREAIRTQGRTLSEAAAKLAPETEPAFRFEA